MKTKPIIFEEEKCSLLEITDINLATYLSAHNVPFKLAEPKVLPGDRIEINFQFEKSQHINDLITAYMFDQPLQTFLKASRFIKDTLMSSVRVAKKKHLSLIRPLREETTHVPREKVHQITTR